MSLAASSIKLMPYNSREAKKRPRRVLYPPITTSNGRPSASSHNHIAWIYARYERTTRPVGIENDFVYAGLTAKSCKQARAAHDSLM